MLGCSHDRAFTARESVQSFLITNLYHVFADDGISEGFDLDGHVSDSESSEGCYQSDAVSPDGSPGIDNAYGSLRPYFEAAEWEEGENLLEDGFSNEIMPILLRISDIQNEDNDEHVEVQAMMVEGPFLYDADGKLLDGQTVQGFPESLVHTQEGRIEDGVLIATNFPFTNSMFFSFVIDELEDTYFLRQRKGQTGALRSNFQRNTLSDAIVSSSAPVELMYSAYDDTSSVELMDDHINRSADMFPDEYGLCQEISSVFRFESIPVHLFGDE